MRHARIPKDAEQIRRRIGFYRIERLARKLLDEETGSARSGVRTIENGGLIRRVCANYSQCVMMDVQLKGPPNGTVNKAALRFGSPHGAAKA